MEAYFEQFSDATYHMTAKDVGIDSVANLTGEAKQWSLPLISLHATFISSHKTHVGTYLT